MSLLLFLMQFQSFSLYFRVATGEKVATSPLVTQLTTARNTNNVTAALFDAVSIL